MMYGETTSPILNLADAGATLVFVRGAMSSMEDAILRSQKTLKGHRKNGGQLLPCEQLQPAAKPGEAHGRHDSIPGFYKIGTASIATDAEGAIRTIGRESASDQLITRVPSVAHRQCCKVEDCLQIAITMNQVEFSRLEI